MFYVTLIILIEFLSSELLTFSSTNYEKIFSWTQVGDHGDIGRDPIQ